MLNYKEWKSMMDEIIADIKTRKEKSLEENKKKEKYELHATLLGLHKLMLGENKYDE
jgi:hypothetical protein